jgi:glutathione S-transferase
MTLQLFELVGIEDDRPFSPYCWRTRMALAHKGLEATSIPWRFTEKDALARHQSEKVPVLLDGERAINDSWAIATYLEDTYRDRPSLFGGEGGRAMGRMINWWGDSAVIPGLVSLIIMDIHAHLRPADQARFKKTLEEVAANRDKDVVTFRKSLDPVRLTLRSQPFLGGEQPNYADYIVFGPFQWARAISGFQLLQPDDAIYAWREKLLDAFGGMARKSAGYNV